jgi:NAD(P)-dependent dehydrogenase (short-subunit alcohol dehydrogenase family)
MSALPGRPLSGRHALVTGGSRGIGRAIAAALAAAGAAVTLLGRDRASLDAALAEGVGHGAVAADVTRGEAVRDAVAQAQAARGAIDLLVANAGAAVSAPFHRADEALFRRMIDVNLMGVVHAAQAVLPGMQERGFGRVVAVASTAGLKGYPYVSAYCAAKHATIGFVRALALEVARSGVTVNAVCPGFADTDLVAESLERIVAKTGRSREEALAELTRHNPQGRLVAPAEVADAVLWLCGAAAGAVTGQAIAVAGGEVP